MGACTSHTRLLVLTNFAIRKWILRYDSSFPQADEKRLRLFIVNLSDLRSTFALLNMNNLT